MEGVGEPDLLVRGAGSPHTYSMRPSEASMLEGADLVFWVGPNMEMFLASALDTLATDATIVELGEAEGLVRLAYREGGSFDAHAHGDEDGHDDHAHGHDDDGHSHEEAHGHDDHDHDDDGHSHEEAHEHDDHAHDHDHDGHSHEEADGHDDHGHDHADDGHSHEEAHGHDDHGHDHEDDGHSHEEAHGHDDHAHNHEDDGHSHEEAHGHDDHGHDHAHGAYDMHFWLDPENAKTFVGEIEAALSAADPDNAETYARNADGLRERLDELLVETSEAVAGIADRGFVVFHDAYQYYENRFGVTASGSITVSPEVMPGAARIDEIRTRVQDLDVTCVLAEPQFEPRLIQVVTEGSQARAGVLDPLGADLEDGPALYFDLIRNMTTSLTECLGGEG
ncbi:MAG: zinc ABC transporter substrate-binding protein [Mesorhizobium sp.]|nr:zinc ABC transporter substrate-binding protein [Mesorhizobium sp.]